MYKIKIYECFVTEFNDREKDWSGDTFYKSVTMSSSYFSSLTLESIAQHLQNMTYMSITVDDLFIDNGIVGQFIVIEDAGGLQDDKGRYLCTYSFMVRPVTEPINLTELFAGGAF